MSTRIIVVGVGPAGLDPQGREQLAGCGVVVTSERLRGLLAGLSVEVLPITPLRAGLAAMEKELATGDVGVLVGGDPLFFGIGRTLVARFGADRCRFHPALSAMQELCARFGVAWDDASFVSLHGRPLAGAAAELLVREKTVVFTDGNNTPAVVARAMLDRLRACGAEERAADYLVRVGECLGSNRERLFSGGLAETAAHRFDPLAIMLVTRHQSARPDVFGFGEADVLHSRGLITKEEVRAVCLHLLRLPERGVFWDVGAGSGSVGLEACLLRPALAGYAVERRPEELANIRTNIGRYGVFNLLPVAGEAPAILEKLPDPDRVFVGGSGGRLTGILETCAARLRAGGRLVLTAVTADTARRAPAVLAECGLPVDVRKMTVERLSQGRRLNPITIVTAVK